mgnify:CR=1 FL=1
MTAHELIASDFEALRDGVGHPPFSQAHTCFSILVSWVRGDYAPTMALAEKHIAGLSLHNRNTPLRWLKTAMAAHYNTGFYTARNAYAEILDEHDDVVREVATDVLREEFPKLFQQREEKFSTNRRKHNK